MVVNAYYSSNGNFFNTYDDIARIETGIKYHFLYTRYDNENPAAVLRAGDFFLKIEKVPDRQIGITLNDLKRLINPDTKVFVYGMEIDDIFHVYNGFLHDAPLKVLNLPFMGIYPSSEKVLDIQVNASFIDKNLCVSE